ncbi:MAG: o-succinylbenzoate synthase [Actinomycetaceae bacterium]|nr:o-succinylbenzoate synthase [Arcanobacterium sp.]MDD7505225.1 o-succinylbenzoate synthase [Actinomycetaceae bacterium]MDY6143313.1 o-succinylbenzoate synthase [Arcanobacterium sp.]
MSFRYKYSWERSTEEMDLEAHIYRVPLKHKFRGITERSGVLLYGQAGWAEVSPFWDYGIEYSSRWLLAGIDAAVAGYPKPRRASIAVNVTIPAVNAQAAYDIARAGGGAHTAKVKIAEPGQSLTDDLARLDAVRRALGPEAHIRVDVNGKWDVDTALESIPQLDAAAGGLEYVEQPCATVVELAYVRRHVDTPIAADESIRRAEDPFRVVEEDAADVVILKNQPLGGVRSALELAARLPLPVVVSSALESSVGLYSGLRFAAALPELNHACGLATAQLFDGDVSSHSLLPHGGEIALSEITPELESPAFTDVDDELRAAWQERFGAMWEYAVQQGSIPANARVHFA